MNSKKKVAVSVALGTAIGAASAAGTIKATGGRGGDLSTLTDEVVMGEVLRRAGRDDFRAMIPQEELEEKPRPARRMPAFTLRQRAIEASGEDGMRYDPAFRCYHCEEPSVAAVPGRLVHLRRCVGCDRRWTTFTPDPAGDGLWVGKDYYPTFIQSMKMERTQ